MPLHPFTSRWSKTQGHSTDLILIKKKILEYLVKQKTWVSSLYYVLQYQSCDFCPSTQALILHYFFFPQEVLGLRYVY